MNAIEFEQVTLGYVGHQVLRNVSFAIPDAVFVALLGANGAGKTTLVRAVLGLLRPEQGRINVLGGPPRRGNPAIGYVPQIRRAGTFAALSGFDLVLGASSGHRWGWPLASRAERESAWEALEAVGAAELARRPIAELSGGERQRVLIAQALLGRPRLLLLDEPLVGLDAAQQHTIVDLARRLCEDRGIAVIFCSHEINPLLGSVDRVLYVGSGHAAIGGVDEVISEPVLSRLYGASIQVVRAEGHIFVMANGVHMEGSAHAHDV